MLGVPVPIGNRTIEIYPPTEAGVVTFESMTASESLGHPFEFNVDVLSATGDIPIGPVLGKPFSVALANVRTGATADRVSFPRNVSPVSLGIMKKSFGRKPLLS